MIRSIFRPQVYAPSTHVFVRSFSKAYKRKPAAADTESEAVLFNPDKYISRMTASVEKLKADYASMRLGRAHPSKL